MSEHRPAATKACGDFICDQEQIMLSTYAFDSLERFRRMESHSRCHLRKRLDDHCRKLILSLSNKRIERRLEFIGLWNRLRELLQQKPFEVGMHAVFRIANAHRARRVAVVCVLKTDELITRRFSSRRTIRPVLHRHLHRHFDSNGARIAQEDTVAITIKACRQPLGQTNRLIVHDSAHHHVRHLFRLVNHGLHNFWMVVPMTSRPPG